MEQRQIQGVIIPEYSDRDREIQHDLELFLNALARVQCFNWTAPTHDIVKQLMNQVFEFTPAAEDEP